MPISVADLAKKLNIAPEAVHLHALDINFEIPEDEIIPDDIAEEICKIELGDEISQTEHEIENELDKEIIEEQQKRTAGSQKKITKKKKKVEQEEKIEVIKTEDGTIILPEELTIKELATKISKPIPIVLVKLKQNGIVANLKESIDYDTAAIVADELGIKVKKEAAELSGEDLFRGNLADLLAEEDPEQLKKRPPVVSIMGHVDHGKTSILDFIRKSKVADKEAGGITQSIGAYQVETKNDKITFLDTPGHEAFTAMRARGAKATDIAVLVVASTEGLKPQSIEAINHAKEAEIPIIVAINKMDLDGANPDLVKKQLAENDLNPEDWGGEVPCIEVSAKTGKGIDKLLETIQIIAELKNLKANPNRSAIGTVIESFVDPKAGILATVLINTGTLKKGDPFVIYNQNGKVRIMKNFAGKVVSEAEPSMPVQISGCTKIPYVGDLVQVVESEKLARKKAEEVASIFHEDSLAKRKKFSLATLKTKFAQDKMRQLKVIVKADSKGSLEAIISELENIKTEESFTKVIHSGVGEITESDILLATAGESIIIGFNVEGTERIKKLAEREKIKLIFSNIIYQITKEVQDIVLGKEEEEEKETILGQFNIKKIFASNKKMAVAGGDVLEGKIKKGASLRQFRKEKVEGEEELVDVVKGSARIESVQLGQKSVKEVEAGTECGLRIEHKELVFQEGDRLEIFIKNF